MRTKVAKGLTHWTVLAALGAALCVAALLIGAWQDVAVSLLTAMAAAVFAVAVIRPTFGRLENATKEKEREFVLRPTARYAETILDALEFAKRGQYGAHDLTPDRAQPVLDDVWEEVALLMGLVRRLEELGLADVADHVRWVEIKARHWRADTKRNLYSQTPHYQHPVWVTQTDEAVRALLALPQVAQYRRPQASWIAVIDPSSGRLEFAHRPRSHYQLMERMGIPMGEEANLVFAEGLGSVIEWMRPENAQALTLLESAL